VVDEETFVLSSKFEVPPRPTVNGESQDETSPFGPIQILVYRGGTSRI
jgi:hypothetical protein